MEETEENVSGLLALSQKTEIPRSKRNNFLLHFLGAGGGVQGGHLYRDCSRYVVYVMLVFPTDRDFVVARKCSGK